jgi:hypothetical protein
VAGHGRHVTALHQRDAAAVRLEQAGDALQDLRRPRGVYYSGKGGGGLLARLKPGLRLHRCVR